ncbi:MAG: OadG family protein [Candidatus Accumulibacter sp.]|jgi:Na+-transporting methylmalonyl-CoA/oxaloacetate decarboxylase gamma subunit|nr:OadG family protein [Accumulibacter sp.]
MENLNWGLQMTVLGMGLVFSLLALLWLLLTVVLKLDKEPVEEETKAAPAQETAAAAEGAAAPADDAVPAQAPERPMVNGLPADLVAAILVATHKHRQTMRRQAAPLVRAVWPGSQMFASRWLATGRARQTNNWQPRGR